MQEYEIVAKFLNPCAGAGRPQTFFEELELEDPDEYVRAKHGAAFRNFRKTPGPDGQLLYTWENGGVTYIYEFTPL